MWAIGPNTWAGSSTDPIVVSRSDRVQGTEVRGSGGVAGSGWHPQVAIRAAKPRVGSADRDVGFGSFTVAPLRTPISQ
jgi:hypothetical protein